MITGLEGVLVVCLAVIAALTVSRIALARKVRKLEDQERDLKAQARKAVVSALVVRKITPESVQEFIGSGKQGHYEELARLLIHRDA